MSKISISPLQFERWSGQLNRIGGRWTPRMPNCKSLIVFYSGVRSKLWAVNIWLLWFLVTFPVTSFMARAFDCNCNGRRTARFGRKSPSFELRRWSDFFPWLLVGSVGTSVMAVIEAVDPGGSTALLVINFEFEKMDTYPSLALVDCQIIISACSLEGFVSLLWLQRKRWALRFQNSYFFLLFQDRYSRMVRWHGCNTPWNVFATNFSRDYFLDTIPLVGIALKIKRFIYYRPRKYCV